jgi:hypothetical protein
MRRSPPLDGDAVARVTTSELAETMVTDDASSCNVATD